MTILIVAPPTDDHAVPVMAELDRRGVPYRLFDLAEIPARAAVSVSFEPGEPMRATVARAVATFDLDAVKTVWLRRITTPTPPPALAAGVEGAWWAVAECHHLLVGLAQALHDRRWVNPLGALAQDGGWGKIRQLQAAREVGLEIPRTLVTNSPEKARAFLASCASAIFKPLASREAFVGGSLRSIFTTEVTPEILARLDAVAHCPCVFQENVPKRVELRVTVMGDRVFATEIDSQSDPVSRTDYRRKYLDVPHAVHALPPDVEEKLLRIHRALGLVHGTSDMIVTPDGRYVYLETNQAGQILWSGSKTGVDLLGAFVDLLQGPR